MEGVRSEPDGGIFWNQQISFQIGEAEFWFLHMTWPTVSAQ